MRNSFKFLIAGVLLAFGTVASAVTVDPVSIDFGTGIGSGGTVTWDGTDAVGTGIAINAVNIANAFDSNADGGYTSNAVLSFDTSTGDIDIIGTIGAPGLGTSDVLFSGAIANWSYNAGIISIFGADGAGTISAPFAGFLGEAVPQVYNFAGFTLNVGEITHSTDFLLVGGDRGITPPEVPIPAAAWLFGSGLLGLVGVARRKPA